MTSPAPVQEHTAHTHGERRSRAPWVWIAVAVLGIGGLLVARGALEGSGATLLPNRVQDLLTLAISVVIESLPFVILGIVLSIVVQVWLPAGLLQRILPRNPVLRRLGISMFGIFLPVCECGNVPLARGLIVGGFTVPEAMTFLLAAPIVNPITIITTHQAFGFDDGILVARVLGGIAIANVVGWLFSLHPRQDELLTPRFAAECRRPDGDHAHTRTGKSLDIFVRETSVIMPALLIGALVAGAIQVVVPRDVLVEVGSNPLWSVLAMMVLAFVIAVCSNVDAFFILPFASTFMPGSIATFLVFGPIIDIKMLAIMRTTFTTKVLVQLTAIVALLSALVGLVVNVLA
ncbi:permease [Leifsonia sp. H3M29-4]|uniref:permease n=1 Tax=Salinibacterium metalliresistens TaxID=3031321 RepID=UPI0023D9E034|nr:permease [Salinibacterium metalliresistens]MDF1478752.1 permease [Salinibacterium metalliresistens]